MGRMGSDWNVAMNIEDAVDGREDTPPISEAFALITELAIALGAAPLSKYVGCWEHNLGGRWLISINGHRTPTKNSTGIDVPPFHAAVERDGWVRMLLAPNDGVFIGEREIEDELIADLKAAIHGPAEAP